MQKQAPPLENEPENRGMRITGALARELHSGFEQHDRGATSVATVIFPAVCAPDALGESGT